MADRLEWLKAKIKSKSTVFLFILVVAYFLAVVLEMRYSNCINCLCKI